MTLFVLIHSPIVGPITWALLAPELEKRGVQVMVPTLPARPEKGSTYWQSQAAAVGQAMSAFPDGADYVLVGHSGAGALLPAIRDAAGRPAAGYIFVDAGLPENGKTRLDLMAEESPEFAALLRNLLEDGGLFPNWDEELLHDLIPNPELRRGILAQLRPQPLAFFDELLQVFSGWPDAPCAYLHFSPSYDSHLQKAKALGWPHRELPSGHFHMLAQPTDVADSLLELWAEMSG